MAEIVLLVGLPASGKSSLRKQLVNLNPGSYTYINYDELRIEMYGEGWKFNYPEEKAMKAMAVQRASDALRRGVSVIVDNTNLTDSAQRGWELLGQEHNVPVRKHVMETPIEECIQRDRMREGIARVGMAVIERMALWNGLLKFNNILDYPRDFIIVDMDGTLADLSHRREKSIKAYKHAKDCSRTDSYRNRPCDSCQKKVPIDWSKFFEGVESDTPIQPILNLVEMLATTADGYGDPYQRYDVIVVSGRGIDQAGKSTEDWLTKHAKFTYRHLFMRNGGDTRPDYIVKEEILDKMISSGLDLGRIAYVIDDRNQVVEMWRKRGLTCLQVADGDF